MKRSHGVIVATVVPAGMAAAVWAVWSAANSPATHLGGLKDAYAEFNTFKPSYWDERAGIHNSSDRVEYHRRRLVELGAAVHRRLVFDAVPYDRESSKRILGRAKSEFPDAIDFSSPWWSEDSPQYGVEPYVIEVWDRPSEMARWDRFFEANNRAE